MADTAIAITAGTGTNVDTRTEGTNGNHRQVVVLGDPATNAGVAPVDATAGLKVDLGTDNDVVVTNAGTFATQATLQAGSAAIGKLAANSGVDIGDVDVTSSALPTGASTSAKQDTVIGHLDGVETLLTTIAGDTTDIEAALETVGGLVVNLGANNDVTVTGAVDLGATDNAVLDAIAASTAAIEAAVEGTLTVTGGGGGVEYTEGDTDASITGSAIMWEDGSDTLRAVSAAKPLPVDIQDSTVAVTQSGTWDEVGINDSGNSITVDYATTGSGTATGALRVELPTNGTGTVGLNAGTNAIGKLAANSGVDIGDVDVTSIIPGTGATNLGKAEDAGHTSGDVGVFNLGLRVDSPNVALTNTDADYSPITTNKLGSLRTAALEDDLATAATTHTYKYYTNAGAVTDGIIWSPAAGKRWFLTSLTINVSAAATVTIEDDVAAGDVVRFKFEFAANSGITIPFSGVPMFSGEDAADLLVTTTAGNVYITCVGYEI